LVFFFFFFFYFSNEKANGNKKTRTEKYVIHWEYQNGTIQIRGDYGTSEWEQGFNLTMSYADGEGIEVGGSKAGTRHHKGTHIFKASEIGVHHKDYHTNDQLEILLDRREGGSGVSPVCSEERSKVRGVWKPSVKFKDPYRTICLCGKGSPVCNMDAFHNAMKYNRQKQERGTKSYKGAVRKMRRNLLRERYWDNYSLSWGFWYFVYNNDMFDMAQLEEYFAVFETNPVVQQIPNKYRKELTFMTNMIQHYNSNPCLAFWYVYWQDVFKKNSDLPGIKKNPTSFDPCCSTALCYRPMGRKGTEAFLSNLEGGGSPLGKKQSVHLDRLFQRIDEIAARYPMSDKIENKQPIGTCLW